MKYFLATVYLAAGIVLPFVYVNIAEPGNIQTREWVLILVLFALCTGAGVNWLFSNNKSKTEEAPASKPKPSPFRQAPQRKIPQPAAQAKAVPAPQPVQKHRGSTVTYPPQADRPDIKALLEDIKNLIKLESWLMALQKANELIHHYPDSPEADKVRGNVNFLIQKTKENK